MTRLTSRATILILVVLVVGLAPCARAATPCNAATLSATFGYSYKGAVAQEDALGHVAAIGLMTFDGKGGLSGSETHSLNGKISRRTYRGTYTVNADCTGKALAQTQPAPTAFDYVILDNATELQLTVSNEGNATLGVAKRKNPDAKCDLALVLGSYGFALDGYYFMGPLGGYMTLSGIYHADGKGHLVASDVVSHNGVIDRRTYKGTYTLEPSCTGVWESQMPDGRVIKADFLTVADGRFEGVFIVTEPGTVLMGADKRISR